MSSAFPTPFQAPRVRFAPSPTGYLHVGGARTALFNWLLARKYGGSCLLRIEDTDKARSTEESTRAIFEGLTWLGLDWDEEVVYQGQGVARHQRDAYAMLEGGTAYRCFCSPEVLEEERRAAAARKESFKYDRRCDRLSAAEVGRRLAAGEPHVLRFRIPGGSTEWDDIVHDRISFPNRDIEDFVILRSDGTPIYNLAVVSDDIDMRITLVMRGDDHISNTPKQILLYQALGAEPPRFAHVPMIHGLDGKKLSKRHGATAVSDYRNQGILPQAMVNFLALLGWSPGGDREVMTLAGIVELFSVDGLQRKAAIFDPKKLEWMNGQHLSLMSAESLEPLVTEELIAAGLASAAELEARHEWYLNLLGLLKVRARTVHDVIRQAEPYFKVDIGYDEAAVNSQWKDRQAIADLLNAAHSTLAAVARWDAETLEPSLRSLASSTGVAGGKVFQPLRLALTGMPVSPGIFEVLVALGRDVTLSRLQTVISRLREGKM